MKTYISPDGEQRNSRPFEITIGCVCGNGASLQHIYMPTDEQLINNGWTIKPSEK